MATKLANGQTLLFIGDSITDCGRRGDGKPLGTGYVNFFHQMLTIREPQKKVNIINKGIGGHRVVDLQNRWTDDVLRHKPSWLSVKIGINDLHCFLRNNENSVSPQLFEETYDEILGRVKKNLPKCNLLLIDPFYISNEQAKTSFRHEVLHVLPKYIKTVEKMSRKYQARRVKTHELFQNLLKYHDADTFCPEPVHPNPTGHLAIAEAIYAALSK
jgi:lysophospholipase L1-like esterase